MYLLLKCAVVGRARVKPENHMGINTQSLVYSERSRFLLARSSSSDIIELRGDESVEFRS